MKKITFLLSLTILLCHNSDASNFDIDLLNKINSPPNAKADKNWEVFSNTASPFSYATPVAMFIVAISKNDKDLKMKSYTAGASIILSSLISTTLKISIKRERPFVTYPDLIYKKTSGGSYSFPSGHTSDAFTMATSLSLAFPKWYVIVPSYLYASAIGYSRMYLGVHYPTDILGGMLTGMGSAFITFEAEKWLHKKNKKQPIIN